MNFNFNMDIVHWLLSQREVLDGAAWLAALGGLIHGICVCNLMTWRTRKCYWLGTLAITISCAALVLSARFANVDKVIAYDFLLLGIALCWLGDKRDTTRDNVSRRGMPAPIKTEEFTR